MRTFALALFALSLTSTAEAQPATAIADRTYVSGAEISTLIEKAKVEAEGGKPVTGGRLLQLAPYASNLEYRTAAGNAAVHEHDAEMYYVLEGSGTLVTGGKLINPKRINASNLVGTSVEGGAAQKIGKGDALIIPENTPHWFSAVAEPLVLISVHIPRPLSVSWP